MLVGNVSLTHVEREKLKKKRSLLYVVGDKRVKHRRKKRVLQTGANIIQYVLRLAGITATTVLTGDDGKTDFGTENSGHDPRMQGIRRRCARYLGIRYLTQSTSIQR